MDEESAKRGDGTRTRWNEMGEWMRKKDRKGKGGKEREERRNGTRHEGAFSRQGVNSAALRLPLSVSSSCIHRHETTSFHLIKTPRSCIQQPDSLTVLSCFSFLSFAFLCCLFCFFFSDIGVSTSSSFCSSTLRFVRIIPVPCTGCRFNTYLSKNKKCILMINFI